MTNKITKKIYSLKRVKEMEGTMFGEIIKEERMKYGYTQESISYHSLGYSSKVEKGLIIPSFDYIKDIGEVMNLDFYQLSPSKKNSIMYKPLINHFVLNNQKELNHLLGYASGFTHQALKTIIAFAIEMVSDTPVHSEKSIEYITNHLHTFDQLLRQFSITLLAIYYYKHNQYPESIRILKALTDTEEDLTKDIKGLVSHYLYVSYQAVNLHAHANTYYQEALDFYRMKKDYSTVTQLELIHLETLYHESRHNVSVFIEELSFNYQWGLNQRHHYAYLDIMSLVHDIEKLDDLAMRVINCLNEKDHTYYAYKLMIETIHRLPFTQKEKEAISQCINAMPQTKVYTQLFHHWQSLKLKDDALQAFLKEVALPDAIAQNDLIYVKYFTDKLVELSILKHRYKESVYHTKKYHRILNKLHKLS